MLKEWPLVAFTVAGQTAGGLFLFAGLPLFFARSMASEGPARGARLAVVLTSLGIMAAAAFVSFFHLHHPFRAVRVLANLRSSWLSREIFFELGFIGLLALLALLLWTGAGEEGWLRGLAAAAGASGILLVWSMSRIYMLEAIPAWNQATTPIGFFLTTLLLGGLTAAAFFRTAWAVEGPGSRLLLVCCLALAAAAFLMAWVAAPGHGLLGVRPAASLLPPGGATTALHTARLALLGAGMGTLALALARGDSGSAAKGPVTPLLLIAWLLVLAAEVAGRFHFYGQVGRPGP